MNTQPWFGAPLTHAWTESVTSNGMDDELAAILPKVKLSRCRDASNPSAVTPPIIVVHVACLGQGTSIRCRWTVSPWSNALTIMVADRTADPGGIWFGPLP